MEEARFWELLERARAVAGGGRDEEALTELADRLTDLLEALPPEQILGFQGTWDRLRIDAFRWDLWGAAWVLMDGCDDECFEFFRNWLIAQGEETYRIALTEQDGLASLPYLTDDAQDDEVAYAAADAYEELLGEELPAGEPDPPTAVGEPFDEKTVKRQYPRLAARFG
jgi:hypothetical protein